MNISGWLPVPFMAITLFVVIISQIDKLVKNPEPLLIVLPVYLIFSIVAPFIGLLSSKLFRLNKFTSIAVAFSTSTRNSLVVLPLALALPEPNNNLVATVIVTQTVIELVAELVFIKTIPVLIRDKGFD